MIDSFPQALQQIIDFYEGLPDDEKREALINEAALAEQYAPEDGDDFDMEDVRKDSECSDTVGIFVKATGSDTVLFKISLGSQPEEFTN